MSKPSERRLASWAAVLVLCGFMAGCVTPPAQHLPEFNRDGKELRVLMMPADVELYLTTAGGALEARADWTESAKANITTALDKVAKDRKAVLVPYRKPENDAERQHLHEQIVKLHGRVGNTILRHAYFLRLPNKDGKFDWTLGPDAKALREKTGADYALFLYVRDSYASEGRVAVMIITGVLFGAVPAGGIQVGFASLVDLRDGSIVWFNRLARQAGDLRTSEAAEETVQTLLASFPK